MKYCPVCGGVMEDGINLCHYCEGNVLTSFKAYLAALEPEEIGALSRKLNADLASFLVTPADVLDFAEAMKPEQFFRDLRGGIKDKISLEDVLSDWEAAYRKEIAEWLK